MSTSSTLQACFTLVVLPCLRARRQASHHKGKRRNDEDEHSARVEDELRVSGFLPRGARVILLRTRLRGEAYTGQQDEESEEECSRRNPAAHHTRLVDLLSYSRPPCPTSRTRPRARGEGGGAANAARFCCLKSPAAGLISACCRGCRGCLRSGVD